METTQEQKMDEKLRQSEAREERFQHLFRHLLHMLEKFIAIITPPESEPTIAPQRPTALDQLTPVARLCVG